MKNKILSYVIVLCMLFGIMVMPVSADIIDSGECGGGLEWTFDNNGTLSIIDTGTGNGRMTNYHSMYGDEEEQETLYTTAPWYSYRESITTVVIESGALSIGRYAFEGCVNITDVYYVNETEEEAGHIWMVEGNELLNPKLVTFHYYDPFQGSEVPNINPNPGTGGGSGSGHSTTAETSEVKVKAEFWAYAEVSSDNFETEDVNCSYSVYDEESSDGYVGEVYVYVHCANSDNDFNVHFYVTKEAQGKRITWEPYDKTYPNVDVLVPYIEGNYAYYLSNEYYLTDEQSAVIIDVDKDELIGKITIPSTLGGYPVAYIDEYAFEGSSLLTGVTIPDSVKAIGEGAFYNCKNLTYITIPDSVTYIGEDAFRNTAYWDNEDNWEDDGFVLYIGKWLIRSSVNPQEEITLKNDTKGIADGSRIEYSNGINVPETNPFLSSKDGILYDKDKTTLIKCPHLWDYQSATDGRKTIFIPDGVKRIETGAFTTGYAEFEGIIIPKSLESIGEYAFGDDMDRYHLGYVCYGGSKEDWDKIDIGEGNKIYPGFFGSTEWLIGYIENYENEDEDIPAIVKLIDETATAVKIPSKHEGTEITAIGRGAFNYCDKLTSVTIPHGITEIRPSAFASCENLADVYYDGTEEEWNGVVIYGENEPLTSANIHFKRKVVQPVDVADIEGDNAVLDMTDDEDVSIIDVSVTDIQNLIDAEKGIEAKVTDENGKNINIVFDKDALSAIAEGVTGNISIKVENPEVSDLNDSQQEQASALASKNPAVYSFNIENGNTDFGTGKATVKVYYDKTGTGNVTAVYLKEDGTTETVPAVYDNETKTVKLTLSHFSDYVIYTEPPHSSGGGGGVSSYTVKFDTNGGDELKNLNIKKGQAIGTIPTPAKKGYVFDGWYSDKELTKEYSADEKVTASTTLFAGWKVDPIRQMTLTIGDKNATVFGTETANDVAPIIRNDRTMLPIRFIAEALGAEVIWDSATKVVTITNDDIEIKITIDQGVAIVNGEEIALDSPAFIESDRTFLPLRFVSENLGAEVDWLEETRQVVITKAIEE